MNTNIITLQFQFGQPIGMKGRGGSLGYEFMTGTVDQIRVEIDAGGQKEYYHMALDESKRQNGWHCWFPAIELEAL